MHIVVCVKQTPASTNVPVDLATGKLKTEGLIWGINPFDEYAVEEALRLKERVTGSTISVISMGPDRAEEAVRSALALGCDNGYLLCDPAFEHSDPIATAYLLSLGVKKLGTTPAGAVQVVLCGKQTNDGESGSVGAALGAWLEWPASAFVKKIAEIDAAKAKVERTMEDGIDTLELPLPAVISVVKEINEPRLPSLKGKMAAKKAVITKWKAAELGADATIVGAGSGTEQVKTAPPPPRPAGVKIEGATPAEKAAKLVDKLKELKFI